MVVSLNNEASKEEFKILLAELQQVLGTESKKSPKAYIKLAGRSLEDHVTGILKELAVGTSFEDSIECISGQKFPDIIAKEYFGIEVKTTIGNHWKTTGNSVFEGTRVPSVERIYLLFGKLFEPVEFKIKPYEECLSEIVVTHSPRYLIDMNIKQGETIFDKLKVSYDELRASDNAIQPITEYYKKQLKHGESLWWIESSNSVNMKIRLWNSLSQTERNRFKLEAFAFFPEIFGHSPTKFNAVTFWLLNQHGIIHPNVRDTFTAGGKCYVESVKKNVPQIIFKALDNLREIKYILNETPPSTLSGFWNQNIKKDKYLIWKDLLVKYVSKTDAPIVNLLF